MGLDMYLYKKTFIGAEYVHRKVTGTLAITVEDKPVDIRLERVSEIVERVGYWRKANAIHKWFVDNVQGGADNCLEYEVSLEKLCELRALCKKAIETKDAALLPPQEGFFFGSTEIGPGYWTDLQDTVYIIDDLTPGDYTYRSSW